MISPNKLHWYTTGSDGVPELYLDNHMMQNFRACEQYGVHSFIEGYSGSGRIWFLDFGSVYHKMIEIYYLERKKPSFNMVEWATKTSLHVWNLYEMEYYKTNFNGKPDKNYDNLGGYPGFMGILAQYATIYHLDNERFRVIGAELYFGKKKEVFLGTFTVPGSYPIVKFKKEIPSFTQSIKLYPGIILPYKTDELEIIQGNQVRVYLSGKIDLLVDNGQNIGPMDHKTAKSFMGKDPASGYYVHEGMEGYVFAAREILKTISPDSSRRCNTMWLNLAQVTPLPKEKAGETHLRFKRIPITYTDEMLEEYRLRMLRTASKIYQLLQADDPYEAADRNTMMCNNFMHRECPYFDAHRQKSKDMVYKILGTDFVKGDIWNPETRDDKLELEVPKGIQI